MRSTSAIACFLFAFFSRHPDPHGPCPAVSAQAEDSGEGVVLLVYGGDEGVRLQPAGSGDDWDLANLSQWGEACLMLANGTPVE